MCICTREVPNRVWCALHERHRDSCRGHHSQRLSRIILATVKSSAPKHLSSNAHSCSQRHHTCFCFWIENLRFLLHTWTGSPLWPSGTYWNHMMHTPKWLGRWLGLADSDGRLQDCVVHYAPGQNQSAPAAIEGRDRDFSPWLRLLAESCNKLKWQADVDRFEEEDTARQVNKQAHMQASERH